MQPTDPRRRTQAERRNGSEEALLDAAAQLVAERGVDGASLARIGERAGTSRGLPTHHFGSKDALVARLADRAQNQLDAAARAEVERGERTIDDVPALERLRLMVDVYLERFEHPSAGDRALIVMWGATFPAEASVEGMVDADRRTLEGLAVLLDEGRRDGSIRKDLDPRAGAVLLQGLLRGVAATFLIDTELIEMGRVREACQAWITAGFSPPP